MNWLTSNSSTVIFALAALFEVLSLLVQIAERFGMDWTESHPPGNLRYQRLRACQIELGIPEHIFAAPVLGMEAPDQVQQLVHSLASDVLSEISNPREESHPGSHEVV